MSSTATLQVVLKIDVGVDGITMTIDSLDKDLAELIASGKDYEVLPNQYMTYDTDTVTIRSKKALAFTDRPDVVPTTPTP